MYKRNNQGWLKHIDFIVIDAVCLQIAFVLAYIIRHGFMLPYSLEAYRTLALMLLAVDILTAAIFNTMHNVLKRGPYKEFAETLKHTAIVFAVMTLYMFSVQTGDVYSRIVMFLTAGFHLVIGYAVRMAWKPVVRRLVLDRPNATMILVADEARIPEILSHMSGASYISCKGIVLSDRDAEGETVEGIKVVANLSDAADYICREWVDEVFIYPDELRDFDIGAEGAVEEEASVAGLISQCRQMAVPVHIRLPLSDNGGKTIVEKVGGYSVLTTASNYATPMQLAAKRTIDIIGGLIGSIAALIIMAVFARRIKKESPGPLLFKQTRIGLNGKKFKIYKIRTMYMDAEERKQELMESNRVSDGMMFKLDWDPRVIGNKIVDGKQVTGIGEKLRSGSWDEWPQFFNVLRGQMSLVGTRPPTVDEWEKYKYHHRARLAAKPGITGMWQVSGRSRITDFEEVVRLDTEYINHWSIGLDLRILLKTVKAVFKKDGAM
ncbi:MAG: sugar transferase [Ruminococcus sp.]|nr:sugar transferase [Ruminococcus sp.]